MVNNPNTYRIDDSNHLIRPRINTLLANAANNPLITICAGVGCGKTQAASDFIRQQKIPAMWMQFNERDNIASRFWDNFTDAIAQLDVTLSEECRKLEFPDTTDKLSQFIFFIDRSVTNRPCFIIIDDFHLACEPVVIQFIERILNELPRTRTMALICRELPKINIKALQLKGFVPDISEKDLNFTESELTEYFIQQGLPADRHTIYEVFKDTGGWAFAVNLVVRSLKRMPNYSGYVKTALKQNIFELMEAESWDALSERFKRFLVRLSLIDHLSAELVGILSVRDDSLMTELRQESAYIHFDIYGGVYQIHHLFLDFLRTKQDILTNEEKRETYKAAADWCKQNNFKIDALGYYEKIEDYESIVSILWEFLENPTYDISFYAASICERAPAATFDRVEFFAAVHLYALLRLGRWQEFSALAGTYEQRFISLPEDDNFRSHSLGGIYFVWGHMRLIMSITDDCYDFNTYYIKSANYFIKSPAEQIQKFVSPLGMWVSAVGTARVGALQEFSEAVTRTMKWLSQCFNGVTGADEICKGELMFYQNDLRAAESFFFKALELGQKYRQFETIRMALLYIMRIGIIQGNHAEFEQALKKIEALLDEENYRRRFVIYDIALGGYYCILRQAEMIPDWLKSEFAPYGHAYSIENFGNQIKARYHYLTRNYMPLLSYIGELKRRKSILFGRIEMLAMEACVHYQMKNKKQAFDVFKEAYEAAAPNDILTPFIEFGKDMRTLTTAVLNEHIAGISNSWLEMIKRKATSYAKNQSKFIAEYNKSNGINKELTVRENDILRDLYNGLSRLEIASQRNLSVSTVKTIITSIYEKLNVNKISDLVRVAAEQGLV
ncbi:MAG: LuxR C-terminal-related transcriptional regulator [Oscillospiraceae bacterium]|nr:LuxR C-terminal-related transcriptional regulator [Oscillospiraceae bacterium]